MLSVTKRNRKSRKSGVTAPDDDEARQLLISAYAAPVFLVERDGKIVTGNGCTGQGPDPSAESIAGRPVYDFFSPEGAGRLQALLEGVFTSRSGTQFQDESEGRVYEYRLCPVAGGDGLVSRVALFGSDVTGHVQLENDLREREARNRAMVEALEGYVFVCSRDYLIEFMNRALIKRTGYDGTGRPCYGVLHGRPSPCPWCMNDLVFKGETLHWEFHSPLDGRWYNATNIPLYHADGRISKQSIFIDITERKMVEEALRRSEEQCRRSEERYKSLFNHAADAILLADAQGSLIECNKEAMRLFGCSRSELLTLSIGDLHPVEDRTRIEAVFQEIIDAGIVSVDGVSIVRRDGMKIPVQIIGSRVAHEGQVMVLGFLRDMTEQIAGQQALENATRRLKFLSQRLLEVQEEESRHLARELHDEIGQALTAIKINLQTALRSEDEGLGDAVIGENVKLVDKVLQQVRSLSLELHPTILDDLGLPAALRWYVDWVCQRSGIRGHFYEHTQGRRLPADVETVCFRIVQEALTNVVRHAKAWDATVRLTEEGGTLILEVSDDGVGFDLSAARERALKGESMGLPGMEERAVLAGGYLTVDSTPGVGTSIRATFSLQGRRARARRSKKARQ